VKCTVDPESILEVQFSMDVTARIEETVEVGLGRIGFEDHHSSP
jgi:hypothetical protein